MSRNGTLLDVTQPADLADKVQAWVAMWPSFEQAMQPYPRSKWLRELETLLAEYYPLSASSDRRLTARHVAPFYLAMGGNVP